STNWNCQSSTKKMH
ncbi:fimV protein, partial [Vibrio parahaemolyticus Peru-288]